jgi:2,4-dienoyl-CoA reductase-like NADH-dependent reductase (Old Yellow Enzyme family)
MKTEKFDGSVSSAYGEKLPKPVKFDGTYEAFESFTELQAANEIPSNDDIVDFVNTRRKNNERQKAMTAALEAQNIFKPDPNDPVVAAQTMIRNLEKMENMKADQKAMMITVLKQQIADIEAQRKAEKEKATA